MNPDHGSPLANGSSSANGLPPTDNFTSETTPNARSSPDGDANSSEEVSSPDESFEARVRELEAIVRTLENGQVPLEDSIKLLQRGMTLARSCDATLAQAEAALEELVATDEGELTTQALDWDED